MKMAQTLDTLEITESASGKLEKQFISRHLDVEARRLNLYGVQILRCKPGRQVEIAVENHGRWVVDFATNGPFGLNLRPEVVEKSIELIRQFGTLHTSIAAGRAQTG